MRIGGLAVAAILAVAVPAQAAEPGPSPTLLQLNETAERMVPRDRLTIAMRVEVSGTDRVRVQAELNRRMSTALAKVKTVETVAAASGNYQTDERTSGSDGKPVPPQWHAVQDLFLIGRNFGTLLNLAAELQADGLTIADMNFDVAPESLRAAQRSLTDDALNALTARAGEIAATLRLKVARIVNLRVGNAMQPPPGLRPVMMEARAFAAAMPPPAVAAGNGTVTLTVDADIALVPEK